MLLLKWMEVRRDLKDMDSTYEFYFRRGFNKSVMRNCGNLEIAG